MTMRSFAVLVLAGLLLGCSFYAPAKEKAVWVHNTLDEIKACKGKLKLKEVRIWGGDEEEDEKKFFKAPTFLAVDKKKRVYVADMYLHNIKVFDWEGEYLRTISRKGQGPGDTYSPHRLAFTTEGDLVVSECGTYRLQYFSPLGKSKRIIRTKHFAGWFGITSKNQLLVHIFKKTFKKKILVSMWNDKGKTVKEIGVYHDKTKDYLAADRLHFTLDGSDNLVVTNILTPVVRIYNLDGAMTMAITYAPPFNIPVKVGLNQKGDEIEIKRPDNLNALEHKVTRSGNAIAIQRVRNRGIVAPCKGIGVDSENRIYIVATKRVRTPEELEKIPAVSAGLNSVTVTERGLPFDREMDHLKILVFSPHGKVIGEAPVTRELDRFIVSGNRIYMTDPVINKRIVEYEIQFEERGRGVEGY
jgi:hypothetical protein